MKKRRIKAQVGMNVVRVSGQLRDRELRTKVAHGLEGDESGSGKKTKQKPDKKRKNKGVRWYELGEGWQVNKRQRAEDKRSTWLRDIIGRGGKKQKQKPDKKRKIKAQDGMNVVRVGGGE